MRLALPLVAFVLLGWIGLGGPSVGIYGAPDTTRKAPPPPGEGGAGGEGGAPCVPEPQTPTLVSTTPSTDFDNDNSSTSAQFVSTSGNFIRVVATWEDAETVATVTDSASNVYTIAHQFAGNARVAVAYAWNITGSSTHTVTITWTGAAPFSEFVVEQWSGIDTEADPLIDTASGTGESTAALSAAMTVPDDTALLTAGIRAYGTVNYSAWFAGAGTEIADLATTGTGYRIVSGANDYTASATLGDQVWTIAAEAWRVGDGCAEEPGGGDGGSGGQGGDEGMGGEGGEGEFVIADCGDIDDGGFLPSSRQTCWSPGVPGGIPTNRTVYATLTGLTGNGTGNQATAIQTALDDAGDAYAASCATSCVFQEVVLPAGTFRITTNLWMRREGVILRGQGRTATKIRLDSASDGLPVIQLGRSYFTDYPSGRGPWRLTANAVRGTNTIEVSNSNASNIAPGDILAIDEEDDTSVVDLGDAVFEKRQSSDCPDSHGPCLRTAGAWRSVSGLVRVTAMEAGASNTTITLAEPLHMTWTTTRLAEVFQVASVFNDSRGHDGTHWIGVEDLYVTGGNENNIDSNNVAYCWIKGVESDGDPATVNTGSYTNPGGMNGRSINLFHAYRCEVRGSYVHHARAIEPGGGAYGLSLSSLTSETLVEDNIVVHHNKGIVLNMAGGGNVVGYNFIDNVYIEGGANDWQEGAANGNHQAHPHNALFEGNYSVNVGSDTTHGNSSRHLYFRNYAFGENSDPPYASGDQDFMRAAYSDGGNGTQTFAGNVLHAGTNSHGAAVFQISPGVNQSSNAPTVWRIGEAEDGAGGEFDDGTALTNLYRHGNYDNVDDEVKWAVGNEVLVIPDSYYLTGKPSFFGSETWPWVDPEGVDHAARVLVLPAFERYQDILEE